MADEPQPPAPAPQTDHQTMVLTDPPPEKHHALLWSLCILAVTLMTGGFVYAYWQFTAPAAEAPIEVEEEAATNSQIFYTNIDSPAGGKMVITLDSEHVYLDGGILRIGGGGFLHGQEPDPGSFQAIGSSGSYFKDKDSVYYLNWQDFGQIEDANPITFAPVFDDKDVEHLSFGKDDKNVYHGSVLVQGADPATFAPFHDSVYYSKDKDYVYYAEHYHTEVIEGADPITFTLAQGDAFDAQDKNYKYLGGEIVE